MRLVAITGPGGIGKTRLSLQIAADLREAFPDGVCYFRLARLTDPELVMPTIAQHFDLKERAGMSLVALLHSRLRDMRALLVLDNFERVIKAATAVATLLESCAGVKALVTSRVTLHLRGEHNYALDPLALPDPEHLSPPVAVRQGNAAEALARVRNALRWTQERDKHVGRTVPTLELLSMVDAMVGRDVRVAYVQGALAVPIERTNAYRSPSWQRDFTAAVAKSRSAIGEEDWQAAYTAGRGLSLEEAVALALRTSE